LQIQNRKQEGMANDVAKMKEEIEHLKSTIKRTKQQLSETSCNEKISESYFCQLLI